MVPPHARQLHRVWRGLPDGPMTKREAEESILKITGREDSGDYAWAGAIRSSLVWAQALIERSSDRPHKFTYERSESFPEWPERNGPGSRAYNEELRRQHEAHELEMRKADQAKAEALANSPVGIERRQLLDLVDRRMTECVNQIVDQRIGELLRSLDTPTVSRMRERFADRAAAGQPEGEITDE
jgi:hypothetical protein